MKALPLILVGTGLAAGFAATPLQEELKVEVRQETLTTANETGGVSVLGQFRTSFSAWLWAKTDVYLHNGQEMRQLTPAEIAAGSKGVNCEEDHEDHGDEHDHEHEVGTTTTLIPGPDRDFRGIFGDIEREVKPYVDLAHHTHNDPKDTLPLFRVMTWADPSFTPGWVTGASMMARDNVDQGIGFLNEGLSANPNSIAILSELGRLYAGKKKDYDRAITVLEKALTVPVNPQQMSEFEADSYLQVFRWAALCQRHRRKIDEMFQIIDAGLHNFPDDPMLHRLRAGDAPLVLTPEARIQWMRDNPPPKKV